MPEVRSAENPVWSRNSERLACAMHPRVGSLSEVRVQSTTGVGAGQMVATGPSNYHPIAWSPDGRHLMMHSISASVGRIELWTLDAGAGSEPQLYLRNDASVAQGQFSPGDGAFVAYSSNVAGRTEVYLQRFPATDERWQVSLEGGEQPRWRGDGRELYYVAPGGALVAVPMSLGAAPVVGTPQTLFRSDLIESDFFFYGGAAMYDVADNGQRFLVNRPIRVPGADTIKVVLNGVGR